MPEETITRIRRILKNNILNSPNDLIGYETERNDVYNLLKRTVIAGESNSALLIGPRGVGKTTLVKNVLNELTMEKSFQSNLILVELNGFVHTDDRLALLSITTQMQLDNAVNGKVFGSFAENLSFLLACLKTGNRETSKSVIFIIDEFDLFTSHHSQTLLYNLFDISQSAQAPICVLGITCRLDVIGLLEKRVKSRFSHRQYFLFPGPGDSEESKHLDWRLKRIKQLLILNEPNSAAIRGWNQDVEKLIKSKQFRMLCQRLLDIDSNERSLKNILINIVSSLNKDKTTISVCDFEEEMKAFEEDEIVTQLLDLSVLELCLLISMKHHAEIYDYQPMNFEMIFTRYVKFANSTSNVQTVQRPVVMKAFEHIQSMELIEMISGTGSRLQKEYQMFKLHVLPQQITEAAKRWQGLPTEVAQWALSSLV